MPRNWFEEAFIAAAKDIVSDVRDRVVFEGWFGRAEPGHEGADRVLHDKLYPDKIGERGFLGWLEAEHRQGREPEPPQPEHGQDFDR